MQRHPAAGEADLIAAASLAFLASSTLPRGLDGSYSSDDDEVCLALPPQRKQGFERACCAERIDYTAIKKHLLEAEECQRASQRHRSSSFQSTGAPSSMYASADRFDANGSDAGNHGSDDTITGTHAVTRGEEQRPGDVHGVGVAGSTDEPRGSGGSDGTARPHSSSDVPDMVKDDEGGVVHQALASNTAPCALKVAADVQELRTLRMELLQGLALHVRGTLCDYSVFAWLFARMFTNTTNRVARPCSRAASAGAAVLVAATQCAPQSAP